MSVFKRSCILRLIWFQLFRICVNTELQFFSFSVSATELAKINFYIYFCQIPPNPYLSISTTFPAVQFAIPLMLIKLIKKGSFIYLLLKHNRRSSISPVLL